MTNDCHDCLPPKKVRHPQNSRIPDSFLGAGDSSLFIIQFSIFNLQFSKRSVSHAAGRSQCRQECRERGYYHLHRQLDDPLFLHNLLLSFFVTQIPQILTDFLFYQELENSFL